MPTTFSNPTLVPAIVVESVDMTSVNGLPAALAGKAALSHTHLAAQVTDLDAVLAELPSADLTEVEASIAALETTVAALPTAEDITAIESSIAGKADASHTHPQSQVTNLVTDLAGKAAVSHTHEAEDVTDLAAFVEAIVPPPIYRESQQGPPLSGTGVNAIVVSGIAFDPPIDDPLPYIDEYLGRNRFGVLSSSGANCYWTGTAWRFYNWGAIWESSENVAYPWLVQTWTPQAPTVGAGLKVDSVMEGTPGTPGQVAVHDEDVYQCVNIQPFIWVKIAKASEVIGI